MTGGKYSLGLDSSTQSLTAVIIDQENEKVVYQKSLDYAADKRLFRYGINHDDYIAPPREPGEADQPPLMYLASLDALFADMRADGIDLSLVGVINDSGQQHGHVYLKASSAALFSRLSSETGPADSLVTLIGDCFSYGTAPIWKTSNTGSQAEHIRRGVGGKTSVIEISGSDSPLRFSGAVVRRVGEQFRKCMERPKLYSLSAVLFPPYSPAIIEYPSITVTDAVHH